MRPDRVAARLAALRALYEPMGEDDARAQLESPRSSRPFAEAVSVRLAELRALVELARHLHRR